MKVLQINAVCGKGSTGRICCELSEWLIANGHESKILFASGTSDYPYAKKIAKKTGIKIHGLMSRITGEQAAFSPFSTAKAIKEIKHFQPSIVHLHNLHGNYINVKKLLRYFAKNDIPTVITLHDCWFFTGKCTYYSEVNCNKWQLGCGGCPQLKKSIPSWFFDRTSKMWHEKKELFEAIPRLGVIGVSDWITGEAKKSFLQHSKIIERVYNWIDLEVFYPRQEDVREKYGLPKDKFLVFCISDRWSKTAFRFLSLLKLAEHLEEDIHIMLAGGIEEGVALPKNITNLGYIKSVDELARLYSQADVYVHHSREDTFGKVIAEAMACGTPAIVYNTTACPELIGEGCGHVVKVGDIDGIKQAIDKVKSVGKEKYSKACIEFVRKHFEKEELIRETLKIYERLQKGD